MMEEMIRTVLDKTIAKKYPHLKLPAVVFATITVKRPAGEWYEYALSILDRFGNADADFPAFPGVYSKASYETGSIVAVAFAYGDMSPVILGEVQP
jgi:hypothetical protein